MSVVTLMAAALDHELRERFNFCLRLDTCEEIAAAMIERAAAAARACESSHRVQEAASVQPWTAFLDGAGEPPICGVGTATPK